MNNQNPQINSFILQGSLLKAIAKTSAPILSMYLLSSLIGLSDMFYAGRISGAAQAAVGIGEQVIFLSTIVASGLCAGIVACVARCVGAGKIEVARLYAREGLILSLLFGFIGIVSGLIAAEPIFRLFKSDTQVAALGVPYLKTCALANLPWIVSLCQSAIFRALGLPKYSLYAWLAISGISVIGGGILFFAPLSPLKFCLSALSVSWIIGSSTGVLLGFIWLPKCWAQLTHEKELPNTKDRSFSAATKRASELLWISGPVTLAELTTIASNFFLYKLFSIMPQSTDIQAAWSVSLKLEETFATMPLMALGLAAATIVGQNLGAGQSLRARQAGWRIAWISALLMIFTGFLLSASSNFLPALLSKSQLVIDYTSLFLKVAPVMLPILAIPTVLFGAMEGAGCTWIPLCGNFTSTALLRSFFAWILAVPLAMGLVGILIALIISRLYICVVAILAFSKLRLEKLTLPAIQESYTRKCVIEIS